MRDSPWILTFFFFLFLMKNCNYTFPQMKGQKEKTATNSALEHLYTSPTKINSHYASQFVGELYIMHLNTILPHQKENHYTICTTTTPVLSFALRDRNGFTRLLQFPSKPIFCNKRNSHTEQVLKKHFNQRAFLFTFSLHPTKAKLPQSLPKSPHFTTLFTSSPSLSFQA